MKVGGRLIFFLLLILSSELPAQILKDLGNKTKRLTSKETRERVVNSVMDDMEEARAEFDSTDFDYAILLSDNSGLFDVKEKGEGTAKVTSVLGMGAGFVKGEHTSAKDKARFQLDLGEVLYANLKFALAEKKFAIAKAIYEGDSLQKEMGYLKTISNQGLLYGTMGRYTQAEEFTAKALKLRQERFGTDNASVAASHNNYGVLKYNLAQYNEAEKEFEDAEAIAKKNGLLETMTYAILLNNQAMLFQTIGRFEEAEAVFKQAISIAEKLQDSKSKNHLKFLSNQALLYRQMGKYPEAEAIYLSMEKRLGKNNPDYANMLNNQAALYMLMGKEDKVEELLKKAAAIYKASFGEDSPAFAKATNDLGNFYRYKARYPEAETLLEKALKTRESALGKNHPDYVHTQEDLAILHWKKGAGEKALPIYHEVMSKSLDFINRYFPPMSEAEKTKYWDLLSPRFQRFYNFALEMSAKNPAVLEDLYDYQIATKALLLNSTNKVKQAILASKNSALIKDYVLWLDQKETLARLYAYSKDELKLQEINLDSLEQAANDMEKKLSARSADFSAGYSAKQLSFKQIKSLLNDTEAVVEIIHVKKYDQNFTKDSKYAALILTKTTEVPKLVLLENGQQLDTRYSKFYRNAIQQRVADEYSYDQYWAPIEPELAGKKMIYISPDGTYNQLNLNTLKKPDADYVINRYDIVIIGNSKDLIELKARKPTALKKNATLVGFPDYGPGTIAVLPGTKIELDGISKVLKTSGYQVKQFMQKTATEANLKSTKSPTIMHIATHGYFLQDVESTGIAGTAFGISLENANDNPLLRSGLMLAGAGATASGQRIPSLESNDNGILTAYEAMNLNLEGTDLIILSACETGLGEVKAGEGVYGLQRAFLVAGADALIMSLWKVDDAATQQLMTNFYTQWLKLGNKQKAFKQAQLQLMAKYKEPYYWGAFVMMGM